MFLFIILISFSRFDFSSSKISLALWCSSFWSLSETTLASRFLMTEFWSSIADWALSLSSSICFASCSLSYAVSSFLSSSSSNPFSYSNKTLSRIGHAVIIYNWHFNIMPSPRSSSKLLIPSRPPFLIYDAISIFFWAICFLLLLWYVTNVIVHHFGYHTFFLSK